jgi:host factor-I protein
MASKFSPIDRNEYAGGRRRQTPSDTTQKEAHYIDWLSRNRVPVVVKLIDNEQVRGWIEYYDRGIIRLTREKEANLFIFKEKVKYIFEDPTTPVRRR